MLKATLKLEEGTTNYAVLQSAVNHLQNCGYKLNRIKWSGWNGLIQTDVKFSVEESALKMNEMLKDNFGCSIVAA